MRSLRITTFGFFALAILAWLAYSPGLSGSFLFDDFANLSALGAYGPVTDWTTFWRYVTSGVADPTGRPLSLLTFLVDAQDWPADPYPFKRTNLMIHIGNGFLLFVLLRQLGSLLVQSAQANAAALLGAAFWMLHPLLVSTTLYIIQREAMLPATFVLAGLYGYTIGRRMASQGESCGAWIAATAILSCTLLGTLSKANGALLPILALTIDFALLEKRLPLHTDRAGRVFRWVRGSAVILPSLLLVAYLAKLGWSGFVDGTAPHRPWSMGERLMTECRIVVQYLFLLWFPRPFTTGLFNDAIGVSTGLLQPWTTLASMGLIAGLLFFAILARTRWPALSLAIGFYFAAHLMESTTVQLELYYEHRNYVPALLMFWPLALWLTSPLSSDTTQLSGKLRKSTLVSPLTKQVLAATITVGLGLLTWMRADLWGNTQEQAALWALQNPESPRAQAYAAQLDMSRGDPGAAIRRLEPLLARKPDELQLALNLLGAKCQSGSVNQGDISQAAAALRSTRTLERMGYQWFQRAISALPNPSCPTLDAEALGQLVAAAWQNPIAASIPGRRQDLHNLRGQLALAADKPGKALKHFNLALEAEPRPGVALSQAAQLAQAGEPELALQHLSHLDALDVPEPRGWSNMGDIHHWVLARHNYWEHEIQHLITVLKQDATSSATEAK